MAYSRDKDCRDSLQNYLELGVYVVFLEGIIVNIPDYVVISSKKRSYLRVCMCD